MVYGKSLASFLFMCIFSPTTILLKRPIFSPLNDLGILVTNHMTMYVRIYFTSLCFISLVYDSVCLPVAHWFGEGSCLLFYWSIVDLQYCLSFRCTAEWLRYIYFFRFFPIIGYYKIVNIVSVLYSKSLLFILYMVILSASPILLIYPSSLPFPFGNHKFIIFFILLFIFHWRIVELQYCVNFRYIAKWKIHFFTFFSHIGYYKILNVLPYAIQ